MVSFCYSHSIDSTFDLSHYLNDEMGVEQLKAINGIGNKTCDNLKRLLGFDTVAVDRHIRDFLVAADILYDDYFDIKEVVEYAADFMETARRTLDYSIWSYMSSKRKNKGELLLDLVFLNNNSAPPGLYAQPVVADGAGGSSTQPTPLQEIV